MIKTQKNCPTLFLFSLSLMNKELLHKKGECKESFQISESIL